jgi:hypothetical protein
LRDFREPRDDNSKTASYRRFQSRRDLDRGERDGRRTGMKPKTALAALVVAVVAAIMLPARAVGETTAQTVTGSGQFDYTSDDGVTALRTFAVQASRSSDRTVTGQAQVKNRATGQTLHIQIDCLNVIDNIAVLSGTATSATGPENSDGDAEILAVQDNERGANAGPDRVTRAFGNSGLVCTDITPTNIGLVTSLLNDIDAGNIWLH